MSKNISITTLPKISNFKTVNNLDVDKRYFIDPKGLNIPISVAKFTKIRELYTLKVMSGENVKNIVLDIFLNKDERFLLHSIDMVKGKFVMKILDCKLNEFTFCDFEKDILRVQTKDYTKRMRLNQKEKYHNKNSKKRIYTKKHPDGYWKKYNGDYGKAKYAFDIHNDIEAIYNFREKYPESNAFAEIIMEYENKQNSQVEDSKETVININPKIQQYIKRIIPLFRNITDEATFMDILHVFIKSGELKSRIDTDEVEKMKNEFSEMKKEISVMSDALALFA